MSCEFQIEPNPTPDTYAAIAALEPANPFRTGAFAAAMQTGGTRCTALMVREDGALRHGCTAVGKSGRLRQTLTIPSMPNLPPDHAFWASMLDFCRQTGVTDLTINSYASTVPAAPAFAPDLAEELSRRPRCEYLLDLNRDDLWTGLSKNHKRNIKRGQKNDLTLRRSADPVHCRDHVELIGASMSRRERRGEDIHQSAESRRYTRLIESGAGELFQMTGNGAVLSSVLILKARAGGYYDSAGTTPEGMSAGASHFLIHEIAEALRRDGCETFNLGGADPEQTGLGRFKAGFGSTATELQAARFFVATGLKKLLIKTASAVRR